MEKNIRVGIIGMGNMGRGHGKNILNMDCARLVAVCSQPADDAERFVQEENIECKVYEDAYTMIETADLDVVYICLPPFAHNGQFEAAAKKGIHIFIEKPIAISEERARSMAEAARENNIYTQVGYQMRFGGAVRRFKDLMDLGVTGKPTLYSASYECNSLHSPWWRDAEKCGGQVFEQVIHLYDMALYLMGNAREVNGYVANQCHQDVEGYTIEDTSVANIRFENGSLGSITGSNCAVKEQWNARFRIICENTIADFTDHNHGVFTYTQKEKPESEIVETEVDVTYSEDAYFMEVLMGKAKPFATVEDGYQGIRMVSGVVKSSQADGIAVEI